MATNRCLVFVVLLTLSSSAGASTNQRPVSIGSDPTEITLQGVFDLITLFGSGIDALADQSSSGLFTSCTPNDVTIELVLELASWSTENEFGVYSADNKWNEARIFRGSESGPSNPKTIAFLTNGTVQVDGVTVATGFGAEFGFYLRRGPVTWYSLDGDNHWGQPQALVYRGDDETVLSTTHSPTVEFDHGQYIVAFEDKLVGVSADRDYQDLIVLVDGIAGAPDYDCP